MTDFHDGKDDGAMRTIGEVGEALDIKPHVLRYWEQQFPMLKPLKRSGGRRYYRPADVELIETIDRLVNKMGYTLKGAKAAIKSGKAGITVEGDFDEDDGTPKPPARIQRADPAPELVEVLPQLKSIRERLAAVIEA